MMKVENEIQVYEVDGNDKIKETLLISSHHIHHDFVVIGVGDQKITVSFSELKKAMENAVNWY